ncbi:MAG: dTDP-4-dehydrorhamnose 3,5-epimerase [Actinomycetota bacterium]|nr:dTDP-4-dehydrorhamnose 3,5-epimerase [Actinomycetota bacterium]
MIFRPTTLDGAYLVDLEPREDERGFFARAWAEEEFAAQGLSTEVVQANIAFNRRKGTLRGMHFQRAPHAEVKLVRCTRGALYDVIVDLRPSSPTHARWIGVELTADNRRMLYVPEGFAHGYQTLVDDTEAYYQVSAAYAPGAEGGVRWDDPAFGIEWPDPDPPVMSEKDRTWPDYRP